MNNQQCNFPKCKKEIQPNITSVGRPAHRQSPVSGPLRSVLRPFSNGNGPSWIWLAMMRLNYGCDKRVCMLLCVDFCVGYCSFHVNFPVGLEKACLRVNRWLNQIANEKISCRTQKCNFWKRPSTDFDKKYIFGIGTSSAIEWYLSFLLSISWPSDEPCECSRLLVLFLVLGEQLTAIMAGMVKFSEFPRFFSFTSPYQQNCLS